jgi:nucleoside-diphosphate-sugar epimerase
MLLYGTVVLPDRGEGVCDAVYVDDVVDAMLLAAQNPNALGERFLVSGPEPITWAEFHERIARALGVKGPEYRPLQEIVAQHGGTAQDLRAAVKDPKKLVRAAVRLPFVRPLLEAGLRFMPDSLRSAVRGRFMAAEGALRQPGHIHVPDPARLKLFTRTAPVYAAKARRVLGFRPRYDFAAGMEPTARYLRWAYGDAPDAAGSTG